MSVNELPSAQELAAYYDGFLDTYHGGGREKGAAARQIKWAQAYMRNTLAFAQSGNLIDVGPANSPFPGFAADHGFDVTILDYKEPPNRPAAVKFVAGSLNDAPEQLAEHASRYDVVTAWAVIEHCMDPRAAARNLVSLAKPGGIIIITTPEIGTIAERYGAGRTSWFFPPEHLHLLSRKALRLLFAGGCEHLHSKKFEFNAPRWVARYGLTLAEGVVGAVIKQVAPKRWESLRGTRLTRASGVTLSVFRKY